jgi:hypothetical protein
MVSYDLDKFSRSSSNLSASTLLGLNTDNSNSDTGEGSAPGAATSLSYQFRLAVGKSLKTKRYTDQTGWIGKIPKSTPDSTRALLAGV